MRRAFWDRARRPSVWKGAVAGAVGGLVASYAMTQFQNGWSRWSQSNGNGRDRGATDGKASQGDDATKRAASAISEQVLHRDLDEREKQVAGPTVHYAFGTTMGALYGVLAELVPKSTKASGVPFGTAVWLGADEIGVPALGLSEPPTATPPSTHAYAFASHVVYGVTADLVRRAVRTIL